MYVYVGLLLAILLICFLFFSLFFRCKKKKICKRVKEMSCAEKCDILRPVIEPFGYCYEPSYDIFSSTIDAPQRMFGYTALYDRFAPHFHMVIDCLPIYFDYDKRTWLIEFWKGQYGINLGCEVGIYQAEELVPALRRKTTLFKSVSDHEMLPMSLRLFHRDTELSRLSKRHWWLTAFHMGSYSEPSDLTADISITFPNGEMLSAFANALDEQANVEFEICGLQIHLLFDESSTLGLPPLRKLICRFNQWQNRILCRLFVRITKPFYASIDRLLFLYYFLPSVFRRIFRDKKHKKCCKKSCRKCRCKYRPKDNRNCSL